jgi:hypothetical protein
MASVMTNQYVEIKEGMQGSCGGSHLGGSVGSFLSVPATQLRGVMAREMEGGAPQKNYN